MDTDSKIGIPITVVGVDKVKHLCEEMDKKIAEMIQLADEIKSATLEITVRDSRLEMSQIDDDNTDTQPCRNEQ